VDRWDQQEGNKQHPPPSFPPQRREHCCSDKKRPEDTKANCHQRVWRHSLFPLDERWAAICSIVSTTITLPPAVNTRVPTDVVRSISMLFTRTKTVSVKEATLDVRLINPWGRSFGRLLLTLHPHTANALWQPAVVDLLQLLHLTLQERDTLERFD